MSNGTREPNLPSPHDGTLRQLVASTSDELQVMGEPAHPGMESAAWAEPSQLFAMLTDHINRLCELAREYRNGSRVVSGSEPVGWQGSTQRDDDRLIAKTAGGDPTRAAVARDACRTWDDLARKGMLGLAAPSRERFVAAAVRSHEAVRRVR